MTLINTDRAHQNTAFQWLSLAISYETSYADEYVHGQTRKYRFLCTDDSSS